MKPLTIALALVAILIAAAGVSLGQTQAQTNPPPLSAPTGVTAVNGPDPGTVTISWEAVPAAAYYRIGWVAYDDLQAVQAEGRNWTEAFTFADFAQRGQTSHTLTYLRPGLLYAFIVASNDTQYGEPKWSAWALLTLNDDATPCPTAAPAPAPTPTSTPTPTPTPRPTPSRAGDYDADQDGLIEISSLAQLDAIRYDLNGNGDALNRPAYATAFIGAMPNMGCPSDGCTGYELVADLDFDTNGNGEADAGDTYWNDGAGWIPIGDLTVTGVFHDNIIRRPFTAAFDGNGHTIANLYISRDFDNHTGLFGYTGDDSVIRRVGLLAADVSSRSYSTGGLVGENEGSITDSYVTGSVSGGFSNTGGLVGDNGGSITASYASVSVSGGGSTGGLVGYNWDSITASYASGSVSGGSNTGGLVGNNSGSITASYAMGSVSGDDYIGGLVGSNSSLDKVTASYWDLQTTGQTYSDGGVGQTTRELQSPTGYTGIYANWNLDLDDDGTPDDPWDFGTSSQYPVLQYAGLNPAVQRQ